MHYSMKDFSGSSFFADIFLSCYKVKANYQRAYIELLNYCYKNNETFSTFLSRYLKTKEYTWSKFLYIALKQDPTLLQSERFKKYIGIYESLSTFINALYGGQISNVQIYEYLAFKTKQLNIKESKVYYALPHCILDFSDKDTVPKDKLTYPAQGLESAFALHNFIEYPESVCKYLIKYGSRIGYSVDDVCTGLVRSYKLSWRQYFSTIVTAATLNDEWFINCCGVYDSLDAFKEALISERIAFDEFTKYTFCEDGIISTIDKLTILDGYATYTFIKEF